MGKSYKNQFQSIFGFDHNFTDNNALTDKKLDLFLDANEISEPKNFSFRALKNATKRRCHAQWDIELLQGRPGRYWLTDEASDTLTLH